MAFETWSGGGRRSRRSTVVTLLAVVLLLAVATAAIAWLPGTTGGPDEDGAPRSETEDAADPDDGAEQTDRTVTDAGEVWHCPVDGRAGFRDDYGYRKPGGRIHRGVDLYAPLGTPVVAPRPGRVERSEGGMAGKQVIVHGQEHRYVFAHLSRFGERGHVEAGETVGYVGTTGNAEGSAAHLHFEIRDDSGPIDPFPLLDEHCR